MPRSLSTSSLSRNCFLPPGSIVPVSSRSRSLRVLLPWSTWATMQKFRNRSSGISDILFSRLPTIFDDEAWRVGEQDQDGQIGRLDARRACKIANGALLIGRRHGRISPPKPFSLSYHVKQFERQFERLRILINSHDASPSLSETTALVAPHSLPSA